MISRALVGLGMLGAAALSAATSHKAQSLVFQIRATTDALLHDRVTQSEAVERNQMLWDEARELGIEDQVLNILARYHDRAMRHAMRGRKR